MTSLATSNTEEGNDNDDVLRKRQYRVGLNLFNLNPEHGVEYLARKGFVNRNPSEVAKFLHGRKGLSKAKVRTLNSRLLPGSGKITQVRPVFLGVAQLMPSHICPGIG